MLQQEQAKTCLLAELTPACKPKNICQLGETWNTFMTAAQSGTKEFSFSPTHIGM